MAKMERGNFSKLCHISWTAVILRGSYSQLWLSEVCELYEKNKDLTLQSHNGIIHSEILPMHLTHPNSRSKPTYTSSSCRTVPQSRAPSGELYMFWWGGNRSTQRKPMQAWGEHSNSTQKGPAPVRNQTHCPFLITRLSYVGPSCQRTGNGLLVGALIFPYCKMKILLASLSCPWRSSFQLTETL